MNIISIKPELLHHDPGLFVLNIDFALSKHSNNILTTSLWIDLIEYFQSGGASWLLDLDSYRRRKLHKDTRSEDLSTCTCLNLHSSSQNCKLFWCSSVSLVEQHWREMSDEGEDGVEENFAAATSFAAALVQPQLSPWDPLRCKDWENQKPSQQCLLRIKRDIMNIYSEPPLGMCIVPEEDITRVHAVITGPFDTPYEGGFFHFYVRFPPDYPIRPPRIKLLTTGDGSVRFNPNLYRSGKVCLSILGTWRGPAWSPAQSLSSVLMSIQSLMNEKPYHNEPGFEQERHPGDCQRYNECIRHETIRVAVCDMVEHPSKHLPDALKQVHRTSFPDFYEYYVTTVKERLHLTGQAMQDPFGEKRGRYDYASLLQRLQAIKVHLEETSRMDVGVDSDSSAGSEMDNEPLGPDMSS